MGWDETDPVDATALAWLRERPGTPVEGIGIVTRIWRLARLLGDDRRRVLADAGADAATLDLLSVLRRAGPPYQLTTRQLTEHTRVTAGAISQRVARAEKSGLVRRTRPRTVRHGRSSSPSCPRGTPWSSGLSTRYSAARPTSCQACPPRTGPCSPAC